MRRSPWRFLWISPDIRNRLLFTGLILVIYRFAAHVPVPNVNREALEGLFGQNPLFSLLDLLSGGTVANFSILAMGVYPYITAQIILQLLVPIIPSLQRMSEEDPRQARKWMERWTFILAVPMAALNAVGQIQLFQQFAPPGTSILLEAFGANYSTVTMVVSMTAGTMFAIWLGNLISEFGLRNQGLSIIIFSGIVARMPANFGSILADESTRLALLAVLIIVTLGTIVAIVFVQEGRRHVPVISAGAPATGCRCRSRNAAPDGQYGRHDPADFRPVLDHAAGLAGAVLHRLAVPGPAEHRRVDPGNLRRRILGILSVVLRLRRRFYLLLHRRPLSAAELRREPEAGRRANPRGHPRRGDAAIPDARVRRITFVGALPGLHRHLPSVDAVPADRRIEPGPLATSSAGLIVVAWSAMYRSIEAELKLRGYDSAVLVR
jgi:hypothetical protein